MSGNAIPIKVYQVVGAGDAQPYIRRISEEASMTFLTGIPVRVNAASGMIVKWAGNATAATNNIAGISTEPASNLTSNGTAKTLTFGSVASQANAVNIPIGAPLNLGDIGVLIANPNTIFVAKCNDAHNIAVTDIGRFAGLTYDSNYYYFLETEANNTATASGMCAEIVALVDAAGTAGGKLAFRFLANCQQLVV